jgi:hypothetical protein
MANTVLIQHHAMLLGLFSGHSGNAGYLEKPGPGQNFGEAWPKVPGEKSSQCHGKSQGKHGHHWLVVWNMAFIFHNTWDNPSH